MARRKLSRRRKTTVAIVVGGIGAGLVAAFLIPSIRRFFVNPTITIPTDEITTRKV